MATKSIPLRFIFRSPPMIEMLTIMERKGLWERYGLDVRRCEFLNDARGSEEMLFADELDMIFGNHLTPYWRILNGYPMVCLAQTINDWHAWIATSQDVETVADLQGKRFIGRALFADDGHIGHENGNRLLQLEKLGVDRDQVDWVSTKREDDPIEAVRDGLADGCFLSPRHGDAARAAGLRVHELPPMPMIHNMTLTTMLPRIQKQPEFAHRIINAMLDAAEFFVNNPGETIELLKNPISPFPERDMERLEQRYDERAAEYDISLYPHAESIVNVHRLASMAYPEVKDVSPLELWDLRPLREVHLERAKRKA